MLTVEKNQPQSYDENVKYFGEMAEGHKKKKKDGSYRAGHPEMQEKYGEVCRQERGRGREGYRWCGVCGECGLLTKTQKGWPLVKTVGLARQIRTPAERDPDGDDIAPDKETFLRTGSRRKPKPVRDEETGKDIQETGMISDMELSAGEMGRIKREHCPGIMTEAMDGFSGVPFLRKKYVFSGIASFYWHKISRSYFEKSVNKIEGYSAFFRGKTFWMRVRGCRGCVLGRF